MFSKQRRYERRPFVEPIRYFVTVSDTGELENIDYLEEIYSEGISVDISEGGLGMITDYPLTTGDILFFEHELKTNGIIAKASIVRWTKEIEDNRYRVGMEFIAYVNKNI